MTMTQPAMHKAVPTVMKTESQMRSHAHTDAVHGTGAAARGPAAAGKQRQNGSARTSRAWR